MRIAWSKPARGHGQSAVKLLMERPCGYDKWWMMRNLAALSFFGTVFRGEQT